MAAAAAGLLLALLAIFTSFWASYYASPRMLEERSESMLVENVGSVEIPLPGCTRERIYYLVNVSSSAPVAVTLSAVRDGRVLREVELGEGSRLVREGSLLLDEPPSGVVLRLRCGSCSVRLIASVRYSSIDENYLLALNVVSLVSSIAGIALLTVGGYGYVLAKRGEGAR